MLDVCNYYLYILTMFGFVRRILPRNYVTVKQSSVGVGCLMEMLVRKMAHVASSIQSTERRTKTKVKMPYSIGVHSCN